MRRVSKPATEPASASESESALSYLDRVLGLPEPVEQASVLRALAAPEPMIEPSAGRPAVGRIALSMAPPTTTPAAGRPALADRSQWDRIQLDPDIELHVRRLLTRTQNKKVERLVELARQILEEDAT